MTGSIDFEIVPGGGLFLIRGVGMWTAEQARAYFERIARAVDTLRMTRRPIRMLVDLRAAHVQTAETAAAMALGTQRLHRSADRVAFVCATMLLALQVKRDVTTPHIAVFDDMAQARDWVEALAGP
jgi:hypothetical protein